jgi:polyhydroxyalkanoate synthesis regulator phasin
MNDGTQEDPAGAGDREERDEALLSQLAGLRKALAQSVVVTGERVQETVEDAVRRGRMTRRDAQELASAILAASRRQTDEIRQQLEALLERGPRLVRRDGEDAEPVTIPIEHEDVAGTTVSGGVSTGAVAPSGAAEQAPTPGGSATPAGAAPSAPLPIPDYDDLTAVLVRKSLAGLSTAELRAVRDHEAAHANRKTVLQAVDRLLAAR